MDGQWRRFNKELNTKNPTIKCEYEISNEKNSTLKYTSKIINYIRKYWKRKWTANFSQHYVGRVIWRSFENIIPYRQALRDHLFSTYAKFFEKLTFLTPWYAHVCAYHLLRPLAYPLKKKSLTAITVAIFTSKIPSK